MFYYQNKNIIKCFVELIPTENLSEIINLLEIIKELVKKYHKQILNSDILETINQINANLADIINILDKINKLNPVDLNNIIHKLKKIYPDYHKKILIKTNSINYNYLNQIKENISTYMNNLEIYNEQTKEIGLFVKGEGCYYQRNLDLDLNKLLK